MKRPVFLAAIAGFALAPLAAQADELPKRKPGLWETQMSGMAGAPAMSVKQCIDANTDQLAQSAVQPGATCSKREIRKVAAGYEMESSCTISGIKADGKGMITGDFVSKVTVDMTTTMSGIPGQAQPVTTKMSIASTRAGDCAAGQSPGDIIMPNGQIVKTPGTK